MTATQFLGAFNDNLFKQLLMLLSVGTAAGAAAGTGAAGNSAAPVVDQQWIAMLVFAAPFLLFSGIAGFLSERHSKRRVIVLSKAAEVLVMLLGLAAFLAHADWGMLPLWCVLFLMGTQSAFFGPGKYGILPEILRPADLPRANGVVLMTTFLAIILGMALAGSLNDLVKEHKWIISAACVLVAVIGTLTSLLVRPTEPADRRLRFEPSALAVPTEVRETLRRDRPLFHALLASCMFWLVAGIVQPAVNALGKLQLLAGHPQADTYTSLLAACVALGIAAGCLLAGWLCGSRADFRVMRFGLAGLVVLLIVLALPEPTALLAWRRGELPAAEVPQWLGFYGSLVVLGLTGICTGMFTIPLQVFLQSRPPRTQKGRIIATMNLYNWVAILLSAFLYEGLREMVARLGWRPSGMFLFASLLIFPVALWYRPRNTD